MASNQPHTKRDAGGNKPAGKSKGGNPAKDKPSAPSKGGGSKGKTTLGATSSIAEKEPRPTFPVGTEAPFSKSRSRTGPITAGGR